MARFAWVAVVIVCIACTWLSVRRHLANTIATHLDIKQPGAGLVVDAMVDMAPSDPDTHHIAGIFYDQTFEAADLGRSIAEFEQAALLSPADYRKWLDLARAKGRAGDSGGADDAFRRALELAPNYVDVEWAYGNFLVREGRVDEGFPLITRAATGDPRLAGPAVGLGMQLYDGDIGKVRGLLGDTPLINAQLVRTLTLTKRYGDAYSAWERLSEEAKQNELYRNAGIGLMTALVEGKQFGLAAAIAADVTPAESERPAIGHVNNGGFETGVKGRSAGIFEWQIGDGIEPQIALSGTQKHSGGFSLWLTFNSFESAFRSISQTVPVEPNGHYQLELWYRSTVKSTAKLRWEIGDARTLQPLGSTPEMLPTADWSRLNVDFKVPRETDGVILRFVREGCGGVVCPMTGTLGLDDVLLSKQ
jgi:tetratricopeptide (TPR) repeat protein